jgi:hypothetical protein
MIIEDDVEALCNLAGRLEWEDYEALKFSIGNKLTQYYNDGYAHGQFDKEAELLK